MSAYPPPYDHCVREAPACIIPVACQDDNNVGQIRQNDKQSVRASSTGKALFAGLLVIARAGLYVYLGYLLVTTHTDTNQLILTQYKTSNGVAVCLAIVAYTLMGCNTSGKKLGTLSSIYCIVSMFIDAYLSSLTAMQTAQILFYLNLVPGILAIYLYSISK